MTCEEMSNMMDTLLNSQGFVERFGEPNNPRTLSLDEYEKSLFLTKAQDELVISIYNGRNASGDSFEETEEARRGLANIIRTVSLSPIKGSTGIPLGIGSNSKFFTLPKDLWYITYERAEIDNAKCKDMSVLNVMPVTQDDYDKTKNNPFRGPNDRRALRLDLSDGVVEIVSKYNVVSYYVRYLKEPTPIVLVDLPDDLTIKKVSKQTECELSDILHSRIVELAALHAVRSRGYISEDNNK